MPVPVIGGLIGHVFGHSHAGDLYGQTRHGEGGETGAGNANRGVDVVELSPAAPKPLPAALVEQAGGVVDEVAQGGHTSTASDGRLREDRVFLAVSALLALGLAEEGVRSSWPGGLPGPTGAELEAAYRRLAQRLMRLDEARNPARVRQLREDTLDALKGVDLEQAAMSMFGVGANQEAEAVLV